MATCQPAGPSIESDVKMAFRGRSTAEVPAARCTQFSTATADQSHHDALTCEGPHPVMQDVALTGSSRRNDQFRLASRLPVACAWILEPDMS